MPNQLSFRYFKISPAIIRLTVMLYVHFSTFTETFRKPA